MKQFTFLNNMQPTEALQNLGLTEKEASVYLALLQMGQGSAYAISAKSGIKKPTTYVILDELRQKGLVLKIPRVKKQLFIAKPPDEFFALAEEKVNIAKNILPELMAVAQGNTPKVKTLYYERVSGAKEMLWYRMKEMKNKEVVGFYATPQNASRELIELFWQWNTEMAKDGIKMRIIVPEHPSLKLWRESDREYGRTVKIVPFEEYSANISIDIGDTFVRVLSFKEPQGVIIENPDVSRTMRQIFEMVWKNRPEKPHGAVEKSSI